MMLMTLSLVLLLVLLFLCYYCYCVTSIVVLYSTIGGDHRIRGRYDNLWSMLMPGQIGPLHKPPQCMQGICFVWVMCCSCYYINSACESVGRALGCMFTVHSLTTSFF